MLAYRPMSHKTVNLLATATSGEFSYTVTLQSTQRIRHTIFSDTILIFYTNCFNEVIF